MNQSEGTLEDGLRLSSGVLYVDSSKWNLKKDVRLVGESQLSYEIDYFGYNSKRDKFIVLDNRKNDEDELARALTAVAMKADLAVSHMFIIVPPPLQQFGKF